MGEAIQQAAQSEANEEVEVALEDDGTAYLQTSVTSGRGEVPDETSYMQAISSEGDPWQQLLQELLPQLEARGKDYSRQVAEWMNDAAGFWLGHMQGRPAMLTAVLATFVGDAGSADWGVCDNDAVQWALGWAVRLQPFLECHPGSRQARGLPLRRGPVMLFSRVLPEDADSDVLPEISGFKLVTESRRLSPGRPSSWTSRRTPQGPGQGQSHC